MENHPRKKIAVFIISLEGGGAERVVSNILQGLSPRFDFHLVLLTRTIVYEIPADVPVFVLEKTPTQNSLLKILKLPLLAWKYFKFLKRKKIEVSLSVLNRPNFINSMQKMFGWRGKVLLSEQIASSAYYTNENLQGHIGRFLIKILYPKADLILPTSAGIELDLRQNFGIRKPFQIINNPVNINFIQKKLSENPSLPPVTHSSKFKFINVGRFQHQKNHRLLLEAFSKIAHLDCQLLLLGDGFLRKEIEQQISDLALKEKVHLLGFVENPYSFLEKADCFVLSSDFEGFPNVLLEALACGLPIVSTDCPTGPRDILAGKTTAAQLPERTEIGWLAPINNPDALAYCMEKAFFEFQNQSPEQRLRHKKRAEVYDLNTILKQFEAVLD